MLSDHRIAAKKCLLTTRAAKWATRQVGDGRTVKEVAAELACDWHTVNDAVTTYGEALLEADRKRLNRTSAIGLDETAFVKANAASHTHYATTVADVENHQIIDILPTRDYAEVARWLDKQPRSWKQRIAFGALDMSRTYAAVYSVVLPKAAQVVDPFHVIALANRCLDAVRRRVQGERSVRRNKGNDPLYRARRVLVMGEEKLDAEATASPVVTPRARRSERRGGHCLSGQRTPSRLLSLPRSRRGQVHPRRARGPLPQRGHAARGAKAGPHHRGLVRQDHQLPPGPRVQRAHRGSQQPDQADQTDRIRVSQLRELPHQSAALRRQTELAGAGLDRRPMTGETPPDSDEPLSSSFSLVSDGVRVTSSFSFTYRKRSHTARKSKSSGAQRGKGRECAGTLLS